MWSKLLTLLIHLADALKRWQRKREQEQYEQQHKQIEEDPAAWFDDHFNRDGHRMPNDPSLPDHAKKASKAESNELDNK